MTDRELIEAAAKAMAKVQARRNPWGLTSREVEVMNAVCTAKDRAHKLAACELGVEPITVKKATQRIGKKMKVGGPEKYALWEKWVLAAGLLDITDMELLEAAAKAAGIAVRSYRFAVWLVDDSDNLVRKWAPLADDVDNQQLADKLHIELMLRQDESCAKTDGGAWICVANNMYPFAATRRAVVCAAAALVVKEPR